MNILDYVNKYDGIKPQEVINDMYTENCAPQIIHDTVQLLKLKDTIDELKNNPDEWIQKHQIETYDPCTLMQIERLLQLSDLDKDTQQSILDKLSKSLYFPDHFNVVYTCEEIKHKRIKPISATEQTVYNPGDIKLSHRISPDMESAVKEKIGLFSHFDEPISIIMVGIQGSGKSTLSKALEEHGVGIRFSQDDWSRKYWNCSRYIGTHGEAILEYDKFIEHALNQGCNVIFDSLNVRSFIRHQNLTRANKFSKAIIIYMDIPLNECVDRDIIRNNIQNNEKLIQRETNLITLTSNEFEPPALDTDPVDAIITNHYDEVSKSYTVSIQSQNEVFKDTLKPIVDVIELVNNNSIVRINLQKK